LSKSDAHNQQLAAKLQDETSKVELLQADLAQIKTVFVTHWLVLYFNNVLLCLTDIEDSNNGMCKVARVVEFLRCIWFM